MGAPDDEMNRRQQLLDRQRQSMTTSPAVGGGRPAEGTVSTVDASAEEMLAQFQNNEDTTEHMTTKKKKSVRYDAPLYTIESLDMDTLREDVFPALDFNDTQKQVAGAVVQHPDESQSDIAGRVGTSKTPVSRIQGILEGRQDPNDTQREVLKIARENPDYTPGQVASEADSASSYVKYILRAYRHARVEVDVPENEETGGETQVTDDQDTDDGQDDDTQSDDADAVEKDLNGDEDVSYKYDTQSGGRRTTRGGVDLADLRDNRRMDDLIEALQEFDARLCSIEDERLEIPDGIEDLEERIGKIESRTKGVQTVVDRMEDQQANLERYVENELDTSTDFEQLEQDVEDLKEQCESIAETMDLEWEETTLGQRVDRIEESLSTHKEALQDLRDRDTSGGAFDDFTREERKEIIVTLAENDKDELLDKFLDSL